MEVLQESRMMIPDCHRRLAMAHADLQQLLVRIWNTHTVSDVDPPERFELSGTVKEIVTQKWKFAQCPHPQAIQDIDEFVSWSEQIWRKYMTCSPMNHLQWMGAVRMRVTMPAQHCDVCQPSAMDDGIVYRPNPSPNSW